MPIKIYGTQHCGNCKVAKYYFDGKELPYEYADVGVNAEKRQEMQAVSGRMSVPTICIGDKVIVGFDRAKIEAALQV